MKILNLTPHPIVLRTPEGEDITLPSAGVARVATLPGNVEHVPGLPVPVASAPAFGAIEGLPDPEPGTVFIVSGMVASRAFGRADVFSPGTGPADGAIRDAAGRIVAVTRLVRAPEAP